MPVKQQYLKFLKKVVILIVIMFIVDRGLGSVLEYYFQNEPLGDDEAFSHSINNPTEDILIYGSSRAVHTYDTKIFSDSLGLSCFNCGRNGSNIIYSSAIIQNAINNPNHKPKLIVLDLIVKEIQWRTDKSGADILAGMVLPYVRNNENFAKLAKELFPKEYYKAEISKLYAYNSQILSIIRNYSRQGNDNVNGYQPLPGSKIQEDPEVYTSGREKIDTFSRQKLIYFVKSVTDKKIPLLVIFSPAYVDPKTFQQTTSMIECKKIMDEYHVPYWDYTADTNYVKKELFYDMNHLNTKGATKFSNEIVARIKASGILKQ